MSDTDVWNTLVGVIRETFEDETLEITRETMAEDIPNWDSLSNVELIVALEAAFRIRFRTGEIANLKNVGHLADAIMTLLREAKPRR